MTTDEALRIAEEACLFWTRVHAQDSAAVQDMAKSYGDAAAALARLREELPKLGQVRVLVTPQRKPVPEVGAILKCLVCALEREWGIFSETTGEAVCVICRDRARYMPTPWTDPDGFYKEGVPVAEYWRAELDRYIRDQSERERDAYQRGYRAHLAAETAAIQKVRDEMEQVVMGVLLFDAAGESQFTRKDNILRWLAALDEFLERRKK